MLWADDLLTSAGQSSTEGTPGSSIHQSKQDLQQHLSDHQPTSTTDTTNTTTNTNTTTTANTATTTNTSNGNGNGKLQEPSTPGPGPGEVAGPGSATEPPPHTDHKHSQSVGSSSSAAGCSTASQLYRGLFMYFVAAVVVGQRRRVLESCHDRDDVLQLFQSLKGVDVVGAMKQARSYRQQQEQALAGSNRQQH